MALSPFFEKMAEQILKFLVSGASYDNPKG